MLKYDIEKYRKLFPVIEEGITYLNHAATSPLSKRVLSAINKYLDERSRTNIDNYLLFQGILTETRSLAARIINSTPDRIAFFDNTSNAINLLASGLEWKAGDRVVLDDIEFPANVYPFLNLKRLGVEIDFVKNRGGRILPEDIEAKISPRTKLLSISHVQFLTGYRSDLATLGKLCKGKGIVFAVDAIQSAGVMEIDVRKMEIDFLAAGGQKWLMAPQGIAFAFVSENLQDKIKQAYLGWTSIKDFFGNFTNYRLDIDATARRYENGTLNYIGITSLHQSISTLLEIGIGPIEEHVLDLGDLLISEIGKIGFQPYIVGDRCERSGITSIKIHDAEIYSAALQKSKIEVALRQGLIRVSPHFYNTDGDIMTLVGKMKEIHGAARM